MKSNLTIGSYQQYYRDMQFERAGLFKLIQQEYGCVEALYPGSFIHITPSFYFPHVIYIDRHPEAVEFFNDISTVLQYIDMNKEYKRSSYIRFLAQDYSKPLPLKEYQFDLLISLYAGGIPRACKQYLKPGGILLINNFQDSLLEAANDPEFNLVGAVRYRRQKYELEREPPGTFLRGMKKADNSPYLKQTSRGMVFVEKEIYFLFKKI